MAKLDKNKSIKDAVSYTTFGKVKMTEMLPALKSAKAIFGFNLSTPNGMVGAIRYMNVAQKRN